MVDTENQTPTPNSHLQSTPPKSKLLKTILKIFLFFFASIGILLVCFAIYQLAVVGPKEKSALKDIHKNTSSNNNDETKKTSTNANQIKNPNSSYTYTLNISKDKDTKKLIITIANKDYYSKISSANLSGYQFTENTTTSQTYGSFYPGDWTLDTLYEIDFEIQGLMHKFDIHWNANRDSLYISLIQHSFPATNYIFKANIKDKTLEKVWAYKLDNPDTEYQGSSNIVKVIENKYLILSTSKCYGCSSSMISDTVVLNMENKNTSFLESACNIKYDLEKQLVTYQKESLVQKNCSGGTTCKGVDSYMCSHTYTSSECIDGKKNEVICSGETFTTNLH